MASRRQVDELRTFGVRYGRDHSQTDWDKFLIDVDNYVEKMFNGKQQIRSDAPMFALVLNSPNVSHPVKLTVTYNKTNDKCKISVENLDLPELSVLHDIGANIETVYSLLGIDYIDNLEKLDAVLSGLGRTYSYEFRVKILPSRRVEVIRLIKSLPVLTLSKVINYQSQWR